MSGYISELTIIIKFVVRVKKQNKDNIMNMYQLSLD